MATVIICLILILICIFAIRYFMKRVAYGCCGSAGDEVKKVPCKDRDLSHYPYQCTIPIEGMSCANCARRVENAFHESDQYYAKVNLKKKQVTVHMKEDTPRKELENIITRAGYAPGSAKSITEP